MPPSAAIWQTVTMVKHHPFRCGRARLEESIPGGAGVPAAPGEPSAPGLPSAPGVPAVPMDPEAPVEPGVPSAPGGPGFPGTPGGPGDPTPGAPARKAVHCGAAGKVNVGNQSTYLVVTCSPGGPGEPGLPGVPFKIWPVAKRNSSQSLAFVYRHARCACCVPAVLCGINWSMIYVLLTIVGAACLSPLFAQAQAWTTIPAGNLQGECQL